MSGFSLCLVPNPAVRPLPADHESYVPLGLLSIATVLRERPEVETTILDPRAVDAASPADLAERIIAAGADVVGFSTMCNTYPQVMKTARLVAALAPETTIVLGGPHASVTDRPTLEHFGEVDYIVRGESELAILEFAEVLLGERAPERAGNLSYRAGGEIRQSGVIHPVLAPDDLPEIDYALLPGIEQYSRVPLDVGRGCPFGCTFCTTNVYWERRYRLRSPEYIVRTARHLRDAFGITNIAFEHDNLTANKRRVAELCEYIIDSGVEFTWNCSARPDCIDEQLLDVMVRAGCQAVFMGIESGSHRVQRRCKKNLKTDRIRPATQELRDRGIRATASFIVGFPFEEACDVEQTIEAMLDLNAIWFDGIRLQMHLLSPVPGAPLVHEEGVRIGLDQETSDISHAGELDAEMWGWIRERPEIFESFYHFVSDAMDREDVLTLRQGWFTLFTHLPATALALRAAHAACPFELVSLFWGDDRPEDAAAGDEALIAWCADTLDARLPTLAGAEGAAVRSVLRFERAAYGARATASSAIATVDHAVGEWLDQAPARAGEAGLPEIGAASYLLVAHDGTLSRLRLPVALEAV